MIKNRLIGLIVLVIFGAVISQCSSASRDDAGQITKSGDLDVRETRVGDCFVIFLLMNIRKMRLLKPQMKFALMP